MSTGNDKYELPDYSLEKDCESCSYRNYSRILQQRIESLSVEVPVLEHIMKCARAFAEAPDPVPDRSSEEYDPWLQRELERRILLTALKRRGGGDRE